MSLLLGCRTPVHAKDVHMDLLHHRTQGHWGFWCDFLSMSVSAHLVHVSRGLVVSPRAVVGPHGAVAGVDETGDEMEFHHHVHRHR